MRSKKESDEKACKQSKNGKPSMEVIATSPISAYSEDQLSDFQFCSMDPYSCTTSNSQSLSLFSSKILPIPEVNEELEKEEEENDKHNHDFTLNFDPTSQIILTTDNVSDDETKDDEQTVKSQLDQLQNDISTGDQVPRKHFFKKKERSFFFKSN